MKTLGLLLICLFFLFGCSENIELPDGYSFMCSPKGKVALKHRGKIGPNVWETKYGAARFARRWEKIKERPWVAPSSKYEWLECEK